MEQFTSIYLNSAYLEIFLALPRESRANKISERQYLSREAVWRRACQFTVEY